MADSDHEKQLLEILLDQHDSIHPTQPKSMRRMIREMIAHWIGDIQTLSTSVNLSTHTIGDQHALNYRIQLFQSLKKPFPGVLITLGFQGHSERSLRGKLIKFYSFLKEHYTLAQKISAF